MLRRTVLVACFLAAFAATATVAQASVPHWIWGKPTEEIPPGKAVPVITDRDADVPGHACVRQKTRRPNAKSKIAR